MNTFRKVLALGLVVPYSIAVVWALCFHLVGGPWSFLPLYWLSVPWTALALLPQDWGIDLPRRVGTTLFALALWGGGLLNASIVTWFLWPRRRNDEVESRGNVA